MPAVLVYCLVRWRILLRFSVVSTLFDDTVACLCVNHYAVCATPPSRVLVYCHSGSSAACYRLLDTVYHFRRSGRLLGQHAVSFGVEVRRADFVTLVKAVIVSAGYLSQTLSALPTYTTYLPTRG